jgi:hypothetical protein
MQSPGRVLVTEVAAHGVFEASFRFPTLGKKRQGWGTRYKKRDPSLALAFVNRRKRILLVTFAGGR